MLQPSQEQAAVPQFRTLKMHEERDTLPRLRVSDLRAEFASAAADDPDSVRSLALAMIRRIDAYWVAIDYCAPMTLGSGGETPTARPAPQFEHRYGTFHWLRINETKDGPEKVWSEAGSICLNTALHLAQWEFGQVLPEVPDLLRNGRIAAMSACKNQSIAGSPWNKNSRKLTNAGVRKRLRQALNASPYAYLVLHPDSGLPTFYVDSDFARISPAMAERAREANRPFRVSGPREAATRSAA
ncbi:hypothetical protein [Paraburkholderia youngii]|uniref:hypothetical protein n=1 Tax=Paraburkholderia youngii TaxID=2782701 RepID=UPI003D206305